jgi:glycosyltransferase involved in cell wall biosynthesis
VTRSPENRGGHSTANPRILLIGTYLSAGAGNRSVGEGLAEHLAASGFQVALTSRRQTRSLRALDMLVTVWRSRVHYDLAQVDVYSGHAFRWAEWVTSLLRAARKPYILTLHGGNLPEFSRQNQRRVSHLLKSASAVTAPSLYLADAMRAFRSDIRILPNALDLDSYVYRERASLTPTLLWVRAFHRIYDPLLAVRVLSEIAGRWEDAHLTMVGPDKDGSLELVRAEATKLGLLSRIAFAGAIPKAEVPNWMARGDVFLNTTTIDNAPVSVIEAMAVGLPVVTTNVGGIPYLIENEESGMLVPPNDAKAMASAVFRLLSDHALATTVSRNARAKAETFSWNNIRPKWEALILEVARAAVV